MIKLWNNKKLPFFIAFAIPFFVLMGGLAALGITPFGDNTLVISDANGQYLNYISYYRSILSGEHSFLCSFSKNLGGNMIGLDSFYLMNPLFLLFAGAEYEQFPMIFGWVSILNASLGGLTMYILLSDIHNHRKSDLIFSTSYALIGYNSVNSFHLMLLTGPWMLPIVALGIRKIFHKKSPLLYTLSIAASLIMNFYTGYMICMASVFFFCVLYWFHQAEEKRQRHSCMKTYAIASLLGGGLSSFLWLPAIISLYSGRVQRVQATDFSFTENFPLIEIFSKLFTGAQNTDELVNGHPAIFCGIFVVALVILFFLNTQVDRRKKIGVAFLLVVYILSFYVATFTSVFHGFNRTFWFPFRYSFVFSFLLICVASEELSYQKDISFGDMKKTFLIIAISAILIFSKSYSYISGAYVLIDLSLLALIGGTFWFYRTYPARADYRSFVGILMILVCFNL